MTVNPFITIRPWVSQILTTIKKDIKTDYLVNNRNFYKAHFGNRPLHLLTQDETFSVFEKELLASNAELIEWVINRFVFKHGDIYHFFASELGKINPQFNEITLINDSDAEKIIKLAAEKFDAATLYIFCRINGVVFSEAIFAQLEKRAIDSEAKNAPGRGTSTVSLEEMLAQHQVEIEKLREKYEHKLLGVQKKYSIDIEALKKQIRSLQHQLSS